MWTRPMPLRSHCQRRSKRPPLSLLTLMKQPRRMTRRPTRQERSTQLWMKLTLPQLPSWTTRRLELNGAPRRCTRLFQTYVFQFVCYFFSYPSSVPGQARWDIPAAAASVGSWSASQRQPAQSDHVGGSTTLVQARSCYQPRPPQARGRRQATSRCQQAQTAV